jgi:hypothetical protein
MRASVMIASVVVVLSACNGPPEASCYRVFESVVTENNGRFLMKVPCPPGQRGVITSGPEASEWQRWHERVDLGAGDVAELRPGENRIVAGGMDSDFAFTALIR